LSARTVTVPIHRVRCGSSSAIHSRWVSAGQGARSECGARHCEGWRNDDVSSRFVDVRAGVDGLFQNGTIRHLMPWTLLFVQRAQLARRPWAGAVYVCRSWWNFRRSVLSSCITA